MDTKKLLKVLSVLALACVAVVSQAASFYVAAHADDIELFMARNVAYDVKSGAKVVFILTTTGSFVRDSVTLRVTVQGAGVFPGQTPPSSTPYYLTREAGHTEALQTWFKLQNKALQANNVTNVLIDGKTVQRTEIGGVGSNVVMYDLRLVDGDDQSNSGLTWFRNQSLTDPSTTISSVDGNITFTWISLKEFVMALISREQDSADSWVNIPEYWEDGVAQTHFDHLDHITTGRLIGHALQDYAAGSPARCIRTMQWIGYFSGKGDPNARPPVAPMPTNYTASEKATQDEVWQALNVAKVAAGGPDTRDSDHAAFLSRMYASSNGMAGMTKFGPCP